MTKSEIKSHVLVWLAFVILVSIVDPFISHRILVWVIGWVMILTMYAFVFYTTSYVILPKYWEHSRAIAAILSLSLLFPFGICYYLVHYHAIVWLESIPQPFEAGWYVRFVVYCFSITQIVAAFNFYYRYTIKKIKHQKATELAIRDKEIAMSKRENEVIQKELRFLKSQFNAHITFNVLTNVYSKVYSVDEEAARTIELFSEILRYSVDYQADEEIPLKVEVDYISRFIELQRVLNKSVCAEFLHEGPIHERTVFPRILISLVENAFKHGATTNPNCPIKLHLTVNGAIQFTVMNAKNKRKKIASSGIGTQNIMQTLEHHYRDQYDLKVEESETSYFCQLTLTN